jgi:hypothetical protein
LKHCNVPGIHQRGHSVEVDATLGAVTWQLKFLEYDIALKVIDA